LTLNLDINFKAAFAGTKDILMYASAAGSLSSDWQDRGDWTVPTTVTAPAPSPTVQPGVNVVDATPSTGTGSSRTFALRYSDSRGATKLVTEWVWFSGGPGACMAYHERATNRVYLLNDAGTAWSSQTLGSGTLQNSFCSIALGSSSVSLSGEILSLKLAVTFKAAFAGTKDILMYASASGGVSSGWRDAGNWTVPTSTVTVTPTPPPTPTIRLGVNVVSVTPGSGSGSSQTFTLQYSDSRGATNLVSEWVWFSGGTGACMVYHERATNRLHLLNDAGTAWSSQIVGRTATLQNSYCAINVGSSSVSISGQLLTLKVALTFKSPFRGTKNIQMFANGSEGLASGWQTLGTWIVP
jgi:hypothetical protein